MCIYAYLYMLMHLITYIYHMKLTLYLKLKNLCTHSNETDFISQTEKSLRAQQ